MGKPSQRQAGGEHLGEEHRRAIVELSQPTTGKRRDHAAEPDAATEEQYGLGNDPSDFAQTNATGLDQAGNHRQDH